MLFQIYGENAGYQLLGWLLVFVGLVVTNELARRSKKGGIFFFMLVPAALTVYFAAIYIGRGPGRGMGPDQPDLYQHEQLVPLCKALCRHRRLHRLHDAQV